MPETKPASSTMAMLDEPETLLPMPEFAQELSLTVGELFGWLIK